MWIFYSSAASDWAIRFPMRLRFSLRMIFVIVTLLGISLCVVLQPTVIAKKFVAMVNGNDYKTAKSLLNDESLWSFDYGPERHVSIARIYAELLPLEWQDFRNCRRRVCFQVLYQETTGGRHVEWNENTNIRACIGGLKVEEFDIDFSEIPTTQLPAYNDPILYSRGQTLLP
jgi:hypothetical protein